MNLLKHINKKVAIGEEPLAIINGESAISLKECYIVPDSYEAKYDVYTYIDSDGSTYEWIYDTAEYNDGDVYPTELIMQELSLHGEKGIFSDSLMNYLQKYFRLFTINKKTNLPVLKRVNTEVIEDSEGLTLAEHEIKQGYNIDTNKLRELLGFKPYPYQEAFIKGLKTWNFWVTCRRSGKSLTATYLALREIFIPNRRVLFVAPTEAYFNQPLEYANKFLKELSEMSGDIKVNTSKGEIKNIKTGSSVLFLSSGMKEGLRSFTANLIIFDEAAFISESEFGNIRPIVRQAKGKFIACTTINEATPKNWLYKEFTKGYLGLNENYFSQRVTAYECPSYTKEEIEEDKGVLEPHKFRCEYMGEFPEAEGVFDIEKFFEYTEDRNIVEIMGFKFIGRKPTKNGKYIIGYDPAKKQDGAGVSVYSMDENKVIASFYLPSYFQFIEQVDFVMKLRHFYNQAEIVLDEGGIGAVIDELFLTHKYVPTKVHYITSMSSVERYDGGRGVEYIPKSSLVQWLQADIYSNKIKGDFELRDLKLEFEGFEATAKTRYVKYEARAGFRDDLINSIMLANFLRRRINPSVEQKELMEQEAVQRAASMVKQNLGFGTVYEPQKKYFY